MHWANVNDINYTCAAPATTCQTSLNTAIISVIYDGWGSGVTASTSTHFCHGTAYSEDSLWLPLGLPVGVVNLSQDHPRLVVTGILKTTHKLICECPRNQYFTSVLWILSGFMIPTCSVARCGWVTMFPWGLPLIRWGGMCDNLGVCDTNMLEQHCCNIQIQYHMWLQVWQCPGWETGLGAVLVAP